MQVTIVQVIDVFTMLNGCMAAACAVLVVVIVMCVCRHLLSPCLILNQSSLLLEHAPKPSEQSQ